MKDRTKLTIQRSDGSTDYERLNEMYKKTGNEAFKPKIPEIPPLGQWLFFAFNDMDRTYGEYGPKLLTLTDYEKWCQYNNDGIMFTRYERMTLKEMDYAYLEAYREVREEEESDGNNQ